MSAEPLPVTPEATRGRPGGPRQRTRPLLSLVPPPVRARRAPFVVLLLVVLAAGLIGLLLLNTASAQDSFRLHTLQTDDATLQQEIQALTSTADGLDDPVKLAKRATELGMIPGGTPVFLLPGQPWPKGAIRLGDMIYVPAPIPVEPAKPAPGVLKSLMPTPAPTPKASAKPSHKPVAKKVVPSPAAKLPLTRVPPKPGTVPTTPKPVAGVPARPTTPATRPTVPATGAGHAAVSAPGAAAPTTGGR